MEQGISQSLQTLTYANTSFLYPCSQDTYIFSYCIAVCPIRSDTQAGNLIFRLSYCTISVQTHPHAP